MISGNTDSSAAKAQISAIRFQAAQLLSTLTLSAQASGGAGGNLLINLGIRELVPHGWKGTSRKIVSGLERSNRIAAGGRILQQVGALVSESRAFAASHSIVDNSLRSGPNSQKLLRKLGAAFDRGSPTSRLHNLIGALDRISLLDLVTNQEVVRVLQERRFKHASLRVRREAPGLGKILQELPGPQDLAYYEARLSAFRISPGVSKSIDGALERLKQGGPDGFRQGVSSIRVAFDNLIVELTQEGDWKVGLSRLVVSEEERGVAKQFHHMLSRSEHPGTTTSREVLLLTLELFAVLSTRLVQLRGLQGVAQSGNSKENR
ncbi:MAG: hypothetical protein WB789_06260 [Thermoplasmata archaeon]